MIRTLLALYWRGDGPLWHVYWLIGVAGTAAFVALFVALTASGNPDRLAIQILLAAFVGFSVWVLVAVWRCAPNVRNPMWGLLARGLTVAWVLNVAFLALFLELDLVVRP